MRKKNRIPTPPRPAGWTGRIPADQPPPIGEVVFCFKYLDFTPRFRVEHTDGEYFHLVLSRWKEVCRLRKTELFMAGKGWRCHEHDWAKTTEKTGFTHLPAHLKELPPFQLGFGAAGGRFHGFFIDNAFHVVWMDPDHLLYQDQ